MDALRRVPRAIVRDRLNGHRPGAPRANAKKAPAPHLVIGRPGSDGTDEDREQRNPEVTPAQFDHRVKQMLTQKQRRGIHGTRQALTKKQAR